MDPAFSIKPMLACAATFTLVCATWFIYWSHWARIGGLPKTDMTWKGLAPLGIVVSVVATYLVWVAFVLYHRLRYGVPRFEAIRPAGMRILHLRGADNSASRSGMTVGESTLNPSVDTWVSYIRNLGGGGGGGGGLRKCNTMPTDLGGIPLQDLSHLSRRSDAPPSRLGQLTNQHDFRLTQPSASVFKASPTKYMVMGLRKLNLEKWLTIDKEYLEYYEAKATILNERNSEVIMCQKDQVAWDACFELLRMVVDFLVERNPNYFQIYVKDGADDAARAQWVVNKITKEEFSLESPFAIHPLEVISRLTREDFNILIKNNETGQHHLMASATVFPAGWILQERAGFAVADLHDPVPQWKEKLSRPVEHYFNRLDEKSCMERSTFFIQIRDARQSLAETLFVQRPADFFRGGFYGVNASNINIRRERQTFRRLPSSRAIAFTVKTTLTPLDEIPSDELPGLRADIEAWPEDLAAHKGRDLWGKVLLDYCKKMCPSSDKTE